MPLQHWILLERRLMCTVLPLELVTIEAKRLVTTIRELSTIREHAGPRIGWVDVSSRNVGPRKSRMRKLSYDVAQAWLVLLEKGQ